MAGNGIYIQIYYLYAYLFFFFKKPENDETNIQIHTVTWTTSAQTFKLFLQSSQKAMRDIRTVQYYLNILIVSTRMQKFKTTT